MPRLTTLLLVLLAACARDPGPTGAFRSPGTPIYSNAAFDFARLPGTWAQAATFGAPCAPGRVAIAPDQTLRARLCLNGAVATATGRIVPTGPGRFRIAGAEGPLAQEWWVVWVDVDYRTLAIGTPQGGFGFILNRDGPLPDDRLAAAAEIFDFNGYDRRRLTPLP
ncbi:MAG: lipocalin family protein [Gemmobacter sp.]